MKFHADDAIDHTDLGTYLEMFIKNLVEPFLTQEKVDRFKQALPVPLPTTSIVDTIRDQYAKVFEAKDKMFELHISDKTKKLGLNELLVRRDEESFWKERVFDTLFSGVNTLMVIDRPQGGGDPYFYLMPFDTVHDIEIDFFGKKIEYLIQREDVDTFLVIDDEKFIRYQKVKDKDEYIVLASVNHNIGFTPVRFIWNEFINHPLIKRSACTAILGMLDEYLVQYVNKKNLDFLNAYLIMWKYEEDDDDEFLKETVRNELAENINGVEILPTDDEVEMVYRSLLKKKSKMGGPGTIISVRAPMDNTEPDLRNPIGFISPPVDSLQYNVSELERLKQAIYMTATGKPENKDIADRPVSNQIQSQYEGERNVLLWVSSQLSDARRWLVSTLAKAYLKDDIECTVDFGSEFFIEDEKGVIENLRDYKAAGASQAQIAFRTESLRQISTKGKYYQFTRLELLAHLEPFNNLTLEVVGDYAMKGLVDFKDFDLKANFPERIAQFEREHGSILAYKQGKNVDFNNLINQIKEILYGYGKAKKFDNGFNTESKATGDIRQSS